MSKVNSQQSTVKGQPQGGYIALFSTIILSAVFVLLFIGMFVLAIGGMERITDKESSFQATSWANFCAEEALNAIRKDPDDVLDISYGVIDDGCEVTDKNDSPEKGDLSFNVKGAYQEYEKIMEVIVDIVEEEGVRTLEIVEWNE